jgi:1,4-dihydroxy-2-naphthoate octaprenyltransferase
VHNFWDFVRLTRPHFLLGGVLLFALGAATTTGVVVVGYIIGQVMVTSTQATAQYVNEYADVEADRTVTHRTWFSGGSGVLTEGTFRPRVALRAAWVTSGFAAAAMLALATRSTPAALLGLVALAVSWSYSMPPLRLLGTGWGEVIASVAVAGLVPIVGALAQEGPLSAELWWAVAILIPVHMAMMLAFELPDLKSDAAVGKRVLAVRLGRVAIRYLMILLLVIAAIAATIAGLVGGLPRGAVLATAAALPPAVAMLAATRSGGDGILTSSAVLTLVVVASALLVGLVQ